MTIQAKTAETVVGAANQAPVAKGVAMRAVTKKYGSFVAVENLTLDMEAGSYCCLLGPSGCGKTTTLRMLAGHEDVTSGEIYIGDRQVNNMPPAKRNTAMVFQSYALFPHKTVWENINFGLKMRSVPQTERKTRVGEMLELVGLSQFGDRKPPQLSGGQQQRVALARALVTRPQVLLLDEPLSALDESLRVKTRSELRKLQQQFGLTFIQVTHAQDEAFSLSDKIVVMDHGRVAQVGTPLEIFDQPASQFVARFVGDNNIFPGKVLNSTPAGDQELIELEVEGIGTVLARGYSAPVGTQAACSVRADRVFLGDSPAKGQINQVRVRVSAIEFTGYVTRVSLILEANGQEILYKTHSDRLMSQPLQVGQTVTLSWLADDCVFLPH